MRMTRLNPIIDSLWSDRLTGTDLADYVELTWGNDTISGGKGNDAIWDIDGHYQNAYPGNPGDHIWLASDDLIYGGDGDDLVFAGWGADRIYGGAGIDTLDYRYSKSGVEVNLILGRGYGDDRSASKGDTISGFEVILGSGHDDLFFLGASAVTVTGGFAADNGNDRFYGGLGHATIHGGGGDDIVFVGAGSIEFRGGEGHDTLSFALSTTGRTTIGMVRDDVETFIGSAHGDTLSGVAGYGEAVTLRGEGGDDRLEVITLRGTTGTGSLFGGAGNDSLTGAGNADWLDGGIGDDRIDGGLGNDMVLGGAGNDSLLGGSGADALFGGSGDDLLRGGDGTGDRLYGGTGNDRLAAGYHDTLMFGEAGADVFVFAPSGGAANGTQRVADFQRGLDRIDVSGIDARPYVSGTEPGITGDQAFLFMGLAGKSAPAGSAAYTNAGGDTIVSLHNDSDGIADFRIVLTGTHSLTAADFIL